MLRQPLVHTTGHRTRQITTRRKCLACPTLHKITQTLSRRNRRRRAMLKSQALKLLLETQTSERVCLWILAIRRRSAYWILEEILRTNLDDHARIGERRVAMAGRHTIDHTTTSIATRRHNMSTRTHTKRIHTTTLHLRHKRVRGVANQLNQFRRRVVVHQSINQRLWVLRTHTHSETLCRKSHTVVMQHLVSVVGGVANGEDGAQEGRTP